jgi:oxygen-independent coproporphyrinogen-3 oxidase
MEQLNGINREFATLVHSRPSMYYRWYPKLLTPPISPVNLQTKGVRGIYIHVPFCDELCGFCPFYKQPTRTEAVDQYVDVLKREIALYSPRNQSSHPLQFVYFGGGTPSILSGDQLHDILCTLRRNWLLDNRTEVTLETHPTHAIEPRLKIFKEVGVNRVSMGVQSFSQNALSSLRATHEAEHSRIAIESALNLFENVAVDLLYGYPGQTMEGWRQELATAMKTFGVQHISCYALVSPSQGEAFVDPNVDLEMSLTAMDMAASYGLDHYASCASSGFDVARLGKECKYELQHWGAPQAEFIGLGPGAFGFVDNCVTANHASLPIYQKALMSNNFPLASVTVINSMERRHRYFALGIKTIKVPLAPYRQIFGEDATARFGSQFSVLEKKGWAKILGEELCLSLTGRLCVDQCTEMFFSELEMAIPHPEEKELRELRKEEEKTI